MMKILITTQSMDIGGVERSLLGLFEAYEGSEIEIDLFLMKHGGEFEQYIPDWIRILPEDPVCASLTTPGLETLKKGHIVLLAKRFIAKIKAGYYVRKNNLAENTVYLSYSHRQLESRFPHLGADQEYDLAISFLGPHYLVADCVDAKKKVAWIHTDYSAIGLDREEDLRIYRKFDYLIGVSQGVCDSFSKIFPEIKGKLRRIENCLPKKQITAWAAEVPVGFDEDEKIRLLSIGRFCYAKNFENIPTVCKILEKKGIDFHWYLIGYGGMEELIRNRIREEGMEDRITILGKKSNPYPYIRSCTAYIQPSRYEGCSVAVREAQLLGKPVIISKFPTSKYQVDEGVDGIILPQDIHEFAVGLAEILSDPDLLDLFRKNCLKNDYSNYQEADTVLSLIADGEEK